MVTINTMSSESSYRRLSLKKLVLTVEHLVVQSQRTPSKLSQFQRC